MPRKRIFFIGLCLLGFVALRAEVVVLRSGSTVEGAVVFRNEEVVVIRTVSGTRYQYPMSEVKEIKQVASSSETGQEQDARQEASMAKRVALSVEIGGGGCSVLRGNRAGGGMSGSLLVGTHDLFRRRIFLGGGIGYLGAFVSPDAVVETGQEADRKTYSFLPITVAVRIPLMQQKHAPMVGAQVGYGIALSKDYSGGLHAGLNIGYCYRFSEQHSLYVAADVLLQQAFLNTETTITDNGEPYVYQQQAGRCLLHYGVRVGVFL